MAGINRVILIGNLGKDPDIMTFDNGVKKASFSLATTESYKNREGNRVDQTEWHNIVMWRGLADIAERFLNKGSQVYIEGSLQTREWTDRNGVTRYTTEIIAGRVGFLGGVNQQAQTNQNVQEKADEQVPEADLPSVEEEARQLLG